MSNECPTLFSVSSLISNFIHKPPFGGGILAQGTPPPWLLRRVTNNFGIFSVSSLNSKFAYETETLTGFDTTKITEGAAIKVGQVVLLRVTMKEGLAATWHNDLNIGLPNKFRPPTAIFGSHRVNAGADLSKNAICILNTNGTIQFLCDQIFTASVPFEFVYPLASF